MKPITKFNSIVLSITTLIVFGCWLLFALIKITNPYLIVITSGFVSFGVYKILVKVFLWIISKCRKFKKWIFGPYYLEGYWAGFYIGAKGNVRFLIESFEQGFDSLVIRGWSYDENNDYHASWESDTVNINVDKGKLSYMYDVNAISDIANNNGIAIFIFDRETKSSPPIRLRGFSADLHIAKKIKALEVKVSETHLPDNILLERARELYNQNREMF